MTRTIPILTTLLFLAACGGDADAGAEVDPPTDTGAVDTAAATTTADTGAVRVADAGLQTPESVLHDADADVYLVSNINGTPLDKDGNGFIARVRPDGSVESLKWIDGTADGVRLSAPKGMAVHGDTLFVTDIDSVRVFDRTTGAYHGARGVPGATFLNDLAVGPDGTLYVSDSGLNADFSSSGTDAVYRFEGDQPVSITEGVEIASPNGIVVADGALIVVAFGGTAVTRLRPDPEGGPSTSEVIAELPGGQLDGVVRMDDGSLLVSSWETESVYRVTPDSGQAEPEVVAEGIPSPADIGWDSRRGRVLIPVFTEDRLELRPVGR